MPGTLQSFLQQKEQSESAGLVEKSIPSLRQMFLYKSLEEWDHPSSPPPHRKKERKQKKRILDGSPGLQYDTKLMKNLLL